jgi:hypothetical protein
MIRKIRALCGARQFVHFAVVFGRKSANGMTYAWIFAVTFRRRAKAYAFDA